MIVTGKRDQLLHILIVVVPLLDRVRQIELVPRSHLQPWENKMRTASRCVVIKSLSAAYVLAALDRDLGLQSLPAEENAHEKVKRN